MYTVNIALLPGYEVKIASGIPSILAFNAQRPGVPVITFQDTNKFVLNLVKNEEVQAIIIPAGEDGSSKVFYTDNITLEKLSADPYIDTLVKGAGFNSKGPYTR